MKGNRKTLSLMSETGNGSCAADSPAGPRHVSATTGLMAQGAHFYKSLTPVQPPLGGLIESILFCISHTVCLYSFLSFSQKVISGDSTAGASTKLYH